MVLKSQIESALNGQQKTYVKKKAGFSRSMNQTVELSESHILIITGVRRCGKSTLMYQISKRVKKDFVYFNFEDPRVFDFEVSDFEKFDQLVGDDTLTYFFDEIQNVENWEVFIRHLHDRGKNICITGSNASLLSQELGTKLTGRNIQVELFPFSYKEFCGFKKLSPCLKSFENYLNIGGFPDFIQSQKNEQLQQLFKDIIYRDIIVRYGIRNTTVFINIALFLIANVGKEHSLNSIKNTFKVGSTNSVVDYVAWLEDSYLLFSVPRFSWSLKSISVNPKKVYTIDTGFARANSLSFSKDDGRLLENLVFLELRRKHKEIYYFKEQGECDFLIKNGQNITNIIQVCYSVHQENFDREVNGIIEALNYFDKTEGTIVTLNQEDEILKDDKVITLIPAWKWFDT